MKETHQFHESVLTFAATSNTTQRKLRKVYPHLIKVLATNFPKSLLSVSTRIKSFEFHLGYHLLHHLRKHLLVIHQTTLKLANNQKNEIMWVTISIRPNFYHMQQTLSIPKFVFNSYCRRNMEEKSHTSDLKKHINQCSYQYQYSSHHPGNSNT